MNVLVRFPDIELACNTAKNVGAADRCPHTGAQVLIHQTMRPRRFSIKESGPALVTTDVKRQHTQ